MAVSGSFFSKVSSAQPAAHRPDAGRAQDMNRTGFTSTRFDRLEPPFASRNWQSRFAPQTVPNTGAWAIAGQWPVRHLGKRPDEDVQRAPSPLLDYTLVF